ncbi:hypothetical protein ACSTI1_00475, partial [Vibrio parahaemolyticus]
SPFPSSRRAAYVLPRLPALCPGCDIGAVAGDSPIKADIKLECEGKEAGKCASNMNIKNERQ